MTKRTPGSSGVPFTERRNARPTEPPRRIASARAHGLAVLLFIAAYPLFSCTKSGVTMDENDAPIACRPNALTPQERAHEGELLREHLASIRETREREDGYSFRYPSDPAL